jgi:long-chain acyl-CoA synthetase
VPNFDGVRSWAERAGHDLPDDPAAVCEDDRVHERIGREVEAVNERFESHETIKQFRLVPEEWTEENSLLTPSQKKKRPDIYDEHEALIEDIYRGDDPTGTDEPEGSASAEAAD